MIDKFRARFVMLNSRLWKYMRVIELEVLVVFHGLLVRVRVCKSVHFQLE